MSDEWTSEPSEGGLDDTASETIFGESESTSDSWTDDASTGEGEVVEEISGGWGSGTSSGGDGVVEEIAGGWGDEPSGGEATFGEDEAVMERARVVRGFTALCQASHETGAWWGPERQSKEEADSDAAGHVADNPEHDYAVTVKGPGL